jgi:hypothetical protein
MRAQNCANAHLLCAFCALTLPGMKTLDALLGPLAKLDLAQLGPLALKKKVSVSDAAAINDVHPATFKRHYAHLIKKIGKRREVVELGDAINLPPPRSR